MATEAQETTDLIGSDKVEGTTVYDVKGEKMGSIARVMIEKHSGHVSYAVLSFDGFWGYRTNITEQQLKSAPKYQGDAWDWQDYERRRNVYDYYNTPWIEH